MASAPAQDYTACPLLEHVPAVRDVVAYKVLVLRGMSPQPSEYKEAEVYTTPHIPFGPLASPDVKRRQGDATCTPDGGWGVNALRPLCVHAISNERNLPWHGRDVSAVDYLQP